MSEEFVWNGYEASNPAHRTLHGFLVLDVQYDAELAAEILTGIQAFRRGDNMEYEGSGNGYEFECRPEGFYIDCLYEGDDLTPVLIDYLTVETALGEWYAYCVQQDAD
ncbi:MAG: hypothetical protein OEZ39_07760 [Gammaproteobacteria bacterium]|nr:hypothetical protein [Gammaproteobacteria bacterium]MDH5651755.1 hypothetical protein [Gammaproteobacteria bacterium]